MRLLLLVFWMVLVAACGPARSAEESQAAAQEQERVQKQFTKVSLGWVDSTEVYRLVDREMGVACYFAPPGLSDSAAISCVKVPDMLVTR